METLNQSPPPATTDAAPTTGNSKLEDARVFVKTLEGWRDSSRGRLAQLKRNIGEPLPGRGVSWFYATLCDGDTKWRLAHANEYFLIATLFDLNRFKNERGDDKFGNLGHSLRRAVANGANEDSTGRRLQILLDADFDEGAISELAFRTRQIVQWLSGRQVGLDYAQLLYDLCGWSHPDRYIQKKWARSFYDVQPFNPTD